MKLEVEGRAPVENATAAQVRSAIASLRSYGPSSFASLTNENGDYVQVAGGGVTCMLERRLASEGRHFRAHKREKSTIFKDGTILSFGGGDIKMLSDEWMNSSDAEGLFIAFLEGSDFPEILKWREINLSLAS